jgi:hypothetical protein
MGRAFLGAVTVAIVTTSLCGAGGQSGAVVRLQSDSAHPIELGVKPVRVELKPPNRIAAADEWSRILSALAPGHRLVLILSDLRTDEPPGTIFSIYLNLPEGAAPRPDGPHMVGSMNYYSVVQPRHAQRAGPSPAHERQFDITDLVERLLASKRLTGPPSITIAATSPPEERSQASIGRIAILEQ